MCLGGTMIGAVTVVSAGFQSTQGNRASTRGLSSFKAWSTGTEHTEKTLAEIVQLAVEYMFPVPSVLAGPSGQQSFLPTSGWHPGSICSPVNPSLKLGLKITEWLCRLEAVTTR